MIATHAVWNRAKAVFFLKNQGLGKNATEWQRRVWPGLLALLLSACGVAPPLPPATELGPVAPPLASELPDDDAPLPAALLQGKSRWQPVRWRELPGWGQDPLFEAWNAWLRSCERPPAHWRSLCAELRALSIGSAAQQQAWMMTRLQPYRIEPLDGSAAQGLLTGYYEPLLEGARQPSAAFPVALHRPPAGLGQRKPWYSRQQIDTLPEPRAALQGREIVWLADPVQAMMLQIQGSGRVRVTEADGSQRVVRLAFAGTNDQPYRSVGRWLLDQGLTHDASWPGIRAWLAQNPQRQQELLWSNPRVVFFREEPLDAFEAGFGPRGAQGVALTPGRSIAVDPASIPYGTPVWLASNGPTLNLQRLVLAQDTGSAITGALRADYFAGWGEAAGELAGRLKQPLQLWALWPR